VAALTYALAISATILKAVYNMTLIANYPSKKACKESIGKPLRHIETSLFGPEYRPNGKLTVANRPHITGQGREWFGVVTMANGLIVKVT
jgi:hypothetical protein